MVRGRRSTIMVAVLFIVLSASCFSWTGDFSIKNETGFTVYWIYITPAGQEHWGEDLLGRGVLLAGESFSYSIEDYPDSYIDVRIVDEDEDSYTFLRFDATNRELILRLDHLDRRRNES